MADLTLSVVGGDRPGIVAAVTGALVDLGGNVAGCRAAQLMGSFALVLAVTVPPGVSPADVETHLAAMADAEGLTIAAAPCQGTAPAHTDGEHCVVSVYGADRPGIVHDAATALAGIGANIVDLTADLVGDPPLYVLGVEVILPKGTGVAEAQSALATGGLRDLEVSVQPAAERAL